MSRRHSTSSSVNVRRTDIGSANQDEGGRKTSGPSKGMLGLFWGSNKNSATKPKGSAESIQSVEEEHPAEENTICNCNCCGTILTYPYPTLKFRCSICNTTNILEEVNKKKPNYIMPHLISYKYVKGLVDTCMSGVDKNTESHPQSIHSILKPLSDYLYHAFGSYRCLNNSFKERKLDKKLHFSTSNLDLEDIRKTFDLLTKFSTKRPLYSALMGVSELLRRLHVVSSDDPRNYLWILIVFEIPFLNRSLLPPNKTVGPMVDFPEIRALCYEILKRSIGVLSRCPPTSLHYISHWYSKFHENDFTSKVELMNLFITYHLKRYYSMSVNPQPYRRNSTGAVKSKRQNPDLDLEYLVHLSIKDEIDSSSAGVSSYDVPLPATQQMNSPFGNKHKKKKKQETKIKLNQYGNDWQLKAASQLLSIFVKANAMRKESIPISMFYNSLVDYVNVKLDFDSWQNTKKVRPTNQNVQVPELNTVIEYIRGNNNYDASSYFICQYPFLISLGGKISILEYEARRQMERKAEEAFINSLDKRIAIDVYFKVKVRRDFIVQDSLRCIKLNQNNLKKSLRVQFIGEPGIDAGGLKKEWFLLLTKALFSPLAGMLENIEDSNLLWFSIVPADNYEIYYLFGAILGLAIYNSTILDLKFPIALYKILLDIPIIYSDYETLYPVTAQNLSKLTSYTPSELEMLSLTFEVTYSDSFGKSYTKELVPNGSDIAVTSDNVKEYINKYFMFFMHDGIGNQLSNFKKGFSNVIGGNALSLFLPEEIQLLICGSEETKLDVDIIKSITKYSGWKEREEALNTPVIQWFWEHMESMSFIEHKQFLTFVTGSDRVPATGPQNLSFRISRAGKDSNRLPVAHTCFNELALYMYSSKDKLVQKLSIAINESAGFGIK